MITESDLKLKLKTYSLDIWKQTIKELFDSRCQFLNQPVFIQLPADFVISCQQFGILQLDGNRRLALIDTLVSDDKQIARNRVELRNMAAQLIDQDKFHGVLVIYHNSQKPTYRLSFIAKVADLTEEGELVQTQTAPRRFTYVLGGNETGTTAAKRLLTLSGKRSITLKDFTEAFSVEKLTREFFKRYRDFYREFCYVLTDGVGQEYRRSVFNNSEPADKNQKSHAEKVIRDFVKKLLGRIVFLHFLQKKGWMGVPPPPAGQEVIWKGGQPSFIHQLFDKCQSKENFHSQCLKQLFFNTLNTDRRATQYVFRVNGQAPFGSDVSVPYLNGGLFDNDAPETNKIDFPADLFRRLFDFFSEYNFTIDENNPDEHEVGIDPEMLGHIFENLLEENREKGAFYTPKEIVQYMCQESLIQYLTPHFPGDAEINKFIRQNHVSAFLQQREHAERMNRLLKEVKICDPAIGSGAFPIGMLQEIYEAKRYLYPHLKTAQGFKPTEVKKHIIQNSIYGVDRDGGAVDIARLRFWLALIVDETEPQPLPNLDYKIMQGDSLLESYGIVDLSKVHQTVSVTSFVQEPQRDLFGNILNPQLSMTYNDVLIEADLPQQLEDYFTESNPKRKTERKARINQSVQDHIDYNLDIKLSSLTRQLDEASNVDYQSLKAKDRQRLNELRLKVTKLEDDQHKLRGYKSNDERPFFLWNLYFGDVLDMERGKGGFDIVIANPPYIQLSKIKEDAERYALEGKDRKEEYQTFTKNGDIYCLFYEKGIRLLRPGGVLTYITSNSWEQTQYGQKLRQYFIEHTNPVRLLNFDDTLLFETATVETNILVAIKAPYRYELQAVTIERDYKGQMPLADYVSQKSFALTDLPIEGWSVGNEFAYKLRKDIETVGVNLEQWPIEIYRGVTTGYNPAFIIKTDLRNALVDVDERNRDVIKPTLRGRDLKRYVYSFNDEWIIFTRRGFDINAYPSIESYLYLHYERLRPRGEGNEIGRKPGNYKWFEIQDNTAYYEHFERPKIIWGELSDEAKFTYDDRGIYVDTTLFIMTGEHLKFLLTILNSRLSKWYFGQISTTSGMGTTRWKKYKIEQLPVPIIEPSAMRPFEVLADYLLFLYDNDKPLANPYADNEALAQTFEDVLNLCVYELYFGEHLRKVEIDVLRFANYFKPIIPEQSEKEKALLINEMYNWLQQTDNPIRNRLILSNIKSKDVVAYINSQTH